MKKLFLTTIGVLLIAAACNQQAAVSPTPMPAPSPTPTPGQTAEWKTYTSTKYSYEVSYNNRWRLEKTSDEFISIHFNIEGGEGQPVIVKVTSDSQAQIENQLKTELTDLTRSSFSSKEVQFAGVSAKKVSFGTEVGGTMIYLLIPRNGKLMTVSYMDGSEEVINTFKFTK